MCELARTEIANVEERVWAMDIAPEAEYFTANREPRTAN
ncbi:MAG: hypothetical protein ACI8TX_003884, partial [Hyphomicrobiaceae bacterium]